MPMTARDVEILKFINEFGFCLLRQIVERFNLNQFNAYRIMRRLKKMGLIVHQYIYYAKPGVYYLTKAGADYTGMPALKVVPIHKYEHQLKTIEVATKLLEAHPHALLYSERRLFKDQPYQDKLKKKHLADAMLILPDKQQIAIEVELTLKSKSRLEQIFKVYAGQFDVNEVWYYCHPSLVGLLQKMSARLPFIKIHNINQFLA